jgi:hypothetical protein
MPVKTGSHNLLRLRDSGSPELSQLARNGEVFLLRTFIPGH